MSNDSHSSSLHEQTRREPAPADILDSLDLGLLVVHPDHTVAVRNAAVSRWLPEGRHLASIFDSVRFLGPFNGWSVEADRVIHGDEVTTFSCAAYPTGPDSPVLLTLRCRPMRDGISGCTTGMVILIQAGGVSDTLEERLEVSQRLVSLGKLSARVAHELNNPLDGILRYINLALRIVKDDSETRLKSYLSESRTGLMRMVRIIGDLLEFSRTSEGELDEIDINEVIEQAIRANVPAADAAQVVIAADYQCGDMPKARGIRLYQVCCNLIRNAIDAMPDGGRVSITSGVVDANVVIRVADTGHGLPEDGEIIFEPFYTTKAPGKGTGLGLAICRDFIESMQGKITASTEPKGGAILTVRIPVASCSVS